MVVSIRRGSPRRRERSPISTCCACRRSPTTFPHPRLAGNTDEDQFATLAALLPGYAAAPGVAVDHPAEGGRRRRFGNMILSRLPMRQVYRHLLPSPDRSRRERHAANRRRGVSSRRRSAKCASSRRISSTTRRSSAPRRSKRCARSTRKATVMRARATIVDTTAGPFHTHLRPAATIITGDFNLEPDDPLHARMERCVRGRHAAALRRVGSRASGRSPSQHVQDLRKGATRRARSCTATSFS